MTSKVNCKQNKEVADLGLWHVLLIGQEWYWHSVIVRQIHNLKFPGSNPSDLLDRVLETNLLGGS